MENHAWYAQVISVMEVQELRPDGILAMVDFLHARFSFFRRWMGKSCADGGGPVAGFAGEV